jgi:hypothetical protein
MFFIPLSFISQLRQNLIPFFRLHKIGSRVTEGTEIATLYSNISLEACERGAQRLLDCVRFADSEADVSIPQLIQCVVDKKGVTEWNGY